MEEMTEAEKQALFESELRALMEMYPEDYEYEDESTSVGDLIKQAAKLGGAIGLLGLEKVGIDTGPIVQKYKESFALGGLAEARKGITTEAGEEMAQKRYQRDDKKADLDKDGNLSEYEKARGDAIQKAMAEDGPELDDMPAMAHGGMACGCDDCMGEGLMTDPVSGNEIPPGSSAENVRDDLEVRISEGEYVLPADVVKWHGLSYIMQMEAEAKMGLMGMVADGLIQYVDSEDDKMICPECDGEGCDHCDGKGYHDAEEDQSGSEDIEDAEVQAEGDPEQEETEVIETPEGNEIEMVGGMTTEEEELEPEDPEEGDEGYYPSENREYTVKRKPMVKFII